MKARTRQLLLVILVLVTSHHSTLLSSAQNQSPTPAKPPVSDAVQDRLKVFIEEVLIPISATDATGRLDRAVELNDLMLKEDGVVQQLESVYRTPANVLLLLDTGNTRNSAKDVRLTRVVARTLVSNLQTDDRLAVIQVNNRVELLQDWTPNHYVAGAAINRKLLPGKESVLVAGLAAALQQFRTVPSSNSHLVFITDGIDRAGGETSFSEALEKLVQANIAVHFISYTSLPTKRTNPIPTRPREKSSVDPHLIAALPSGRFKEDPTPDLKTILETKGGVTIDIDRIFSRKGIKDQLKHRESEFRSVAEETGGSLWIPSSDQDMVDRAVDVARTIDSQYVISYKPSRPLSSVTASEFRRVEVVSRRVGLHIKVRRGYLATRAR